MFKKIGFLALILIVGIVALIGINKIDSSAVSEVEKNYYYLMEQYNTDYIVPNGLTKWYVKSYGNYYWNDASTLQGISDNYYFAYTNLTFYSENKSGYMWKIYIPYYELANNFDIRIHFNHFGYVLDEENVGSAEYLKVLDSVHFGCFSYGLDYGINFNNYQDVYNNCVNLGDSWSDFIADYSDTDEPNDYRYNNFELLINYYGEFYRNGLEVYIFLDLETAYPDISWIGDYDEFMRPNATNYCLSFVSWSIDNQVNYILNNSTFDNGYSFGYEAGLKDGSLTSFEETEAYTYGYNVGKQQGYEEGLNTSNPNWFGTGLLSLVDIPFILFNQFLNFEILGVNFYYLLLGIFSIGLVVWLIRKFMGGN